ncbi:MAG: AAA family ATPase [Acidobacteriota bacterium]|nr:AAA family ATPase [Acidobacteriota bacterium]MDW3229274.1 AAA family ATPase [Acidobacteriota bacterium]
MNRRLTEFRLIGLTGTNGAGKGEVAAFFQKKGYDYVSLSDIIREELRARGLEASRDNLIACGNELREKFGADILARRATKKIKGPTVIDSIRNSREIEYLRSLGDFILIAVDAPIEIRFERVKKRGRDESAVTLEEFRKKEELEKSTEENSQQLEACLKLADLTIINDGQLEQLWAKLEELG